MTNQNRRKLKMNESILLKKKHDIKVELILHYDTIKSDIDIQSQKLLIDLTEEEKRKEILNLNELLIEKVNEIFEKNMMETDSYFSDENHFIVCDELVEDIKTKAFKKYCLFIDGECLRNGLKESNSVGILIISDFYFNQDQQSFIK